MLMRICMLTSGHDPVDDRIFYKEVTSLKKNYDDINIIAPNERNESIQDIKIIGIAQRKNLRNRFKPALQLYHKGLELNADVYHCHEPDSLIIGYLLKKKLKCKVIYDSHEYHPEAFAERFPIIFKWIMKKTVYWGERFFAKRADFIVTVNTILVDKFKKYHPDVVLIPNYPKLEMFNFKDNEYNNNIDFIYIGGLAEVRGISKIVEASRILKERKIKFNVRFVGRFISKDYEKEINTLIRDYNLKNEIIYHGYVEHSQVSKILKRAKAGLVLLQPEIHRYTISEPIKLFEYMGNGLPVITNNYEMVRNIIVENDCGILVDPSDPIAIANAMEDILNNPEKWNQKGKNGIKAVKEKYNWEIFGEKLIAIYAELAKSMNV